MPGARSVAVRTGNVAFLDPLTGTWPRSFRPPSIHTSSMLIASPVSWVFAGATGAGCLTTLVFVLVFAFIGYPAVSRSEFEDAPGGRGRRVPPRGADRIAPCMDRPDCLRSQLHE